MKPDLKHSFPAILCPAMRARMGDRWYYFATMTFKEIADAVQPVPKLPADAKLKLWIQRELRPERTSQIANYLITQKQRFFNSLVLGIFDGEPEWQPVEVEESFKIKGQKLDERQANAFGMIHLSGQENIFAVDGQHRVEGIREAVKRSNTIANEEQAVIFIAHHETEVGRERTRRLFATLNTYARPITERETVAISEDNAFAIATRKLIDEYPGLDLNHVALLAGTNIPPKERSCVTSVVALYQLTKFLAPLDIRKYRRKFEDGPPDATSVDVIFGETRDFWDALKKHIAPIREVCAANPKLGLAAKYRHSDGGHLLFRPAGMQAFARAARILKDRGVSTEKAVSRLAKVPLQLDDRLWREVFWRPETKRMLHKYVVLGLNVFLNEIGAAPEKSGYSVAQQYKRITGLEYPN